MDFETMTNRLMMASRELAETDEPAQRWGGRGIPLRGSRSAPLYIYLIFQNRKIPQ